MESLQYKGHSSPEGQDGLSLRSFLLWGRDRLRGKREGSRDPDPSVFFLASTEAGVGFAPEAVTGSTGWSLSRSTSRAVPLTAGYVLSDCFRVLSRICGSTTALCIRGGRMYFSVNYNF